jgi:hypothetical protein
MSIVGLYACLEINAWLLQVAFVYLFLPDASNPFQQRSESLAV